MLPGVRHSDISILRGVVFRIDDPGQDVVMSTVSFRFGAGFGWAGAGWGGTGRSETGGNNCAGPAAAAATTRLAISGAAAQCRPSCEACTCRHTKPSGLPP